MDTQETGPSNDEPLDTNTAAEAFEVILSDEPRDDEKAAPPDAATPEAQEAQAEEAEEQSESEPTVTVKIDGKEVEVPISELKNGYQRQADYTRKTMELAEQRKAAEAQAAQARQERQAYAANLQRMQVQLEAALQEQQQTNWNDLLANDPAEYLKQRHLAEQRQAQLNQVYGEQQRVAAQQQAEQAQAYQAHLQAQQQALLAKLPEWKDPAKARAERVALREYLASQGYDEGAINSVADARAVMLARKAMLYDQMMSKADVAQKRVSTLPTKVQRPGAGVAQGLDRRTAAYQRLSKSGRVEDAADVFASLL